MQGRYQQNSEREHWLHLTRLKTFFWNVPRRYFSNSAYAGVTSDVSYISREGKMDIKMLDELLRGTIDPTHRNEAEKKLTEVTHVLL